MKKFTLGFITAIAVIVVIYFLQLLVASFVGTKGDPPKGIVKNPSPGLPTKTNKQVGFLSVKSDPSGHLQPGQIILFYNSTHRTLQDGAEVEFDRKTERIGNIFDGTDIDYGKITKVIKP
jgi:hypothetical protein